MNHATSRSVGLCLSLALSTGSVLAGDAATRPAYPKAPRADQVDDYHGTRVADPFRPLEDADSPETRAGHGAGKPTSKLIDEATDQLAFLAKTFGGNPK